MSRSKKLDKQTLYEIYRACRLCGAGAAYKMPIIQNFVPVEGEEVELKEKIRECLQLEVNLNDNMPPLICELCVDKVDEFYEFLTTCRQTDVNTRRRLGLPLQPTVAEKLLPAPVKATPASKVAPVPKKVVSKDIGTETCMLGLIEASAVKQDIYIVSRPELKKTKNSKIKKEEIKQESTVKTENPPKPLKDKSPTLKEIKQGKVKANKRKRDSSPKRTTRPSNSSDDIPMDKVQETLKTLPASKPVPASKPGPKSKKMVAKEDLSLKPTRAKEKEDPPLKPTKAKEKEDGLGTGKPAKKEEETPKSKGKRDKDDEPLFKLKRVREKDAKSDSTPPPSKKAKSSDPPKPIQPTKPQKSSKPSPKPVPTATTVSKTVQPDGVKCPACDSVLKNISGFKNHMHHAHPVTWTPDNLACNACRDWFATIEESVAHHKKHTHYKCLRCKKKFKNGVLYHQHVENKRCLPDEEVPDVKCDLCWRTFATNNLLTEHRCPGPDGREGGRCSKCKRNYALLKNLMKHERSCMLEKKVENEPVIEPEVKERLLPMQVRITKCDDLLEYGPVVSACTVPHRYGLDRKMSYPYMPKLRVIKKSTFNPMIFIQDQSKEDSNHEDFNWADFEDIELKTVKKLSTLCIKVIFSSEMLGELEVLDEIESARRAALKKRIDSIIFHSDDASSTHSDSLLDKNALAKTFEVVNDKFWSEDKNEHSDSTVFDDSTVTGEGEKGSDPKSDDFVRDIVDNHDNSENLAVDNGRIDNNELDSSILSNTDVNINTTYGTSIVNVKEPSNDHLELSKTLRDDVTNDSSSNLSTVNEEKLENGTLEIDKSKMVKNPTDTHEHDVSLDENMRFDNIRSSNDSPSVINIENSTNDDFSTRVTENKDILGTNDDILSKNDLKPNSSEELVKELSENAINTDSNDIVQNNESNVNSEDKEPQTLINTENSTDDDYSTKATGNNGILVTNDDVLSKNYVEPNSSEELVTENAINTANTAISNDIVQNNESNIDSERKEPQTGIEANHDDKSFDFSVTSILNHVTSKNMDTNSTNVVTNIEKDENEITNTKSIENDGKQSIIAENHAKNDKINDDNKFYAKSIENDTKVNTIAENDTKTNDDNQFPDNLSLTSSINEGNNDHSSSKNDSVTKTDDTMSINSISTTFTEKNDDNLSLKYSIDDANLNKNDKFNVNDLSDDERRLMAELDEQIGENNDVIDKLSDGRDLNLDNFSDSYNFD